MTEEEVQALQTELENVKTELEGIKAEKETLTSEKETIAAELESFRGSFGAKEAAITELEQTVAAKDADILTLKQGMVESDDKFTSLQESLSQAVSTYKTAVAQANPGVPGGLITGDTIEAEIAAGKVPAGAPARTPPDLSALSPREKIEYAIGGKK